MALLCEPELVSDGRADHGDAMFLARRRELSRIVVHGTKLVKRDEHRVQAAWSHKVAHFHRRLILPDVIEGVGDPRRHRSEVAGH